ncbi:hypothetical protein AVEN_156254-1 [Araneus ventricosus]|uniref:Uncharacterized protein n=1 Tax=Araneus ventricosus TaxID=182803 RepID=A0A4Y2ER62_ARAVE|nr:hypothetical protein AVEN_156254-1 [Araneus ventricosus]
MRCRLSSFTWKLFFLHCENFDLQRDSKRDIPFISCPEMLKLVQLFEETGHLVEHLRRGRPSFIEQRVVTVQRFMEDMENETSAAVLVKLVKGWDCLNYRSNISFTGSCICTRINCSYCAVSTARYCR